jgi:hypothetical protein
LKVLKFFFESYDEEEICRRSVGTFLFVHFVNPSLWLRDRSWYRDRRRVCAVTETRAGEEELKYITPPQLPEEDRGIVSGGTNHT